MKRSIVALCSVALMACSTASTEDATTDEAKASEPTPITQQDVEGITNAMFNALKAGDAAAYASHFSSDGAFISARGKVEGQQAIQEFWADANKGGAAKNLDLKTVKWATSGDVAWALGEYTGGVTAPEGNTLTVLQRQPDGTLKVLAQASIPKPAK